MKLSPTLLETLSETLSTRKPRLFWMKESTKFGGKVEDKARGKMRNNVHSPLVSIAILLAAIIRLEASPAFTVLPSGHEGFDVYADGVLVAPIRLSANGAIVA